SKNLANDKNCILMGIKYIKLGGVEHFFLCTLNLAERYPLEVTKNIDTEKVMRQHNRLYICRVAYKA
ncbi:hypothetical protein ACJX0J_009643, partial [Zea mays]